MTDCEGCKNAIAAYDIAQKNGKYLRIGNGEVLIVGCLMHVAILAIAIRKEDGFTIAELSVT